MRLSIHCKAGKLSISDDALVQLSARLRGILWRIPCQAVRGLVAQPETTLLLTITLFTAHSMLQVSGIARDDYERLLLHFPHAQTTTVGRAWYCDPLRLVHTESYDDEGRVPYDQEGATPYGWTMFDTQRINGKLTITYVRNEEWQFPAQE